MLISRPARKIAGWLAALVSLSCSDGEPAEPSPDAGAGNGGSSGAAGSGGTPASGGKGGTGGSAGVTGGGGSGGSGAAEPVTVTVAGMPVALDYRPSAVYDPADDQMTIIATLLEPSTSVRVFFPGETPDDFECSALNGTAVGMTFNRTTDTSPSASYSTVASVTPCTIVVSEVGPVGSRVRGTFSGTVVRTSGVPSDPEELVLTDGAFDVIRASDVGMQ